MDSRWLLATVFTQCCFNKNGRFLVVEEHRRGRLRGHIIVSEGRNGEGWRTFAVKLCWVVNFFQSILAGHLPLTMGESKPLSALTPPAERGERLYVEVLKSPPASSCSKGDFGKVNLVDLMGQSVTWGLPFAGASGSGGIPCFYTGGACPRMGSRFGESFDFITLRGTLKRIHLDVGHCLAWLDLG